MTTPRILVISGSMGAGKTTVMGEISDLLTARQIRHAAIDLDAVSLQLLPDDVSRELHFRNLSALSKNCLDAGIDRFVVAVAVDSGDVLADLQAAFPGTTIIVARLSVSALTMESRLRVREPGVRQAEFLERSRHLDRILADSALEDFIITNDQRSVTDVAHELLERAGWI
jgi:hypothetical protein